MFRFLLILGAVLNSVLGAHFPLKGLIRAPNGRITGGVPVNIQEYPHQVSLRQYGSHRCGGSIVRINVILTAAHCTVGISPSDFTIVAGITYLSETSGTTHQVKSKLEHHDYEPNEFLYDLSLLWLTKSLEFGEYIQPIKLASFQEKLKEGTMVRVTGWGTLEYGGTVPDQLQAVYIEVIGKDKCAQMYEEEIRITETMLCAGEPYGVKDACQGDSGGPLIVNNKQYGIVSFGVSCGLPEYPRVYTDVGSVREWIDFRIIIS